MSTVQQYASVTVSPTESVITATVGVQGPPGPPGPQGEAGEPGPVGVVWQGAYDETLAYAEADTVYFEGEVYRATASIATGTAPPNGAWALMVGISPELQSLVDEAAASASDAAASETNAASSASAAATSASNAATSATEAATSASNAADSATAASTSETNAADSAAAAATSETNAASSASDAAASATAAADSESLAQSWASEAEDVEVEPGSYSALHHAAKAEQSATAAASSQSAAASSASAAATSETNAADSASAAAISASDAATSATNAADSASAAATSESNAATSATNAADSASAAANSATNAADSETAALSAKDDAVAAKNATENIFDTFDDRFLGSFASDPTTDNDGNPLIAGAVYYNTTTQEVYFYNGATWDAPAAQAETSATNALASENAAADSASAAASSASAAATSETNAADSASAAATSESNAANSATAAATSESNAASSATDAANSASAAATSETNAANSASAAATSETNAADSASAAATSESNAATSASNAASSASAAATSETNAADSAAAAAESLDTFDDTYLGTKASAPTTDNDGDPLITGALYYNTTDAQLYIWSGSAWDEAAFSATGTVTSFNGREGAITLQSGDVTTALGYTPQDEATAFSGEYADLTGAPTISTFGETLIDDADAATARTTLGLGTAATTDASAYATATQGDLADTAVQPADLATVATSGSYGDLTNTPTITTFGASLIDDADATAARVTLGLGTAATSDVTAYATAAQGDLADTAVQPGDLATVATTGAYADLSGTPTITTFGSNLIDDIDAAAGRTTLGLGTAATTDASAYATAAEGDLANTAVQPGDLATVATSGAYGDLTGTPTITTFGASLIDDLDAAAARTTLALGTAATTDVSDYATAAQGDLADTAVQPGDLADVATSGAYADLTGTPTITTFGASLVDDLDAAAARTTLELGTAATTDASAYATASEGDLASTAVQPGDLATVATTGAYGDLTNAPTISTYGATLIDDADAPTARTTLGLGSAATTAASDYATAAQGDLADTAVQPGDLATVATTGSYADLTGTPTITTFGESLIDDVDATAARTTLGLGTAATTDASAYATAAEGDLANTAVQPGDLATVATSGAYADLTGTPTISAFGETLIDDADAPSARTTLGLGTAATAAASDYATAAQGDLADTAVQPADLATVATSGAYSDLTGTPSISTFGETLIDDADAATARSTLGLSNSATRSYTISTGDPSGGSDGDVWYKVS